jgi:hypothetical protein
LSLFWGRGISQVSSSWKLKTKWWILSTVCYDSAKNSCHYSTLEHNHHPPICWPVTSWFQIGWDSCNCLAEGFPGGGEEPCRTKMEDCWGPHRTRTFIQARRDITIRKAERHQGQTNVVS